METISVTFNKFLEHKKNQVKKPTYNKYASIINLFEGFLNSYSYNYLNEEDHEFFKTKFNEENEEFCEIFSIEKISTSQIEEFLGYFLIRKVIGDRSSIKYSGTVMRALTKWLKDNLYIEDKEYNYWLEVINEIKGKLTKALEVADILSEFVRNNRVEYNPFLLGMDNNLDQYETTREAVFFVTKIEDEKLWVTDYSDSDKSLGLGPVIVPGKVGEMVSIDWQLYLVIGKKENEWHILESGNVYPSI